MTDSQSQWPAQHPRYSSPDDADEPAAAVPAPPAGCQPPQAEPVTRPNGQQPVPSGFPVPPAGYPVPPASYPVPPSGYPVPPSGYSAPASGYPVPPASYGPPQPGSYGPSPAHYLSAHAAMRASSADRERTVDVLKAGFAEGRLTQEEYNERMGRAYSARTYGELTSLAGDLPAGPLPAAWPVPAQQVPPAGGTNSMAVASMVLGVAEFFTAGLTAVPAVICGHMARRQMKLTGQRGDGLATSGLVLGYMAIIFWSVLIAASLVGVAISIAHNGGPASYPGP